MRDGLADHAQACYGRSVGKSMKAVGLAVISRSRGLTEDIFNFSQQGPALGPVFHMGQAFEFL